MNIVKVNYNGNSFSLLCNASPEEDGVILHERADLQVPGFIDGIQWALAIFPYARADAWFKEYYVYGKARDLIEDFHLEYANLVLCARAKHIFDVSDESVDMASELIRFRLSQLPPQNTKKTHPSELGYVYLLQAATGHYKIGRTANPKSRAKTFGLQLPFEVSFICLIQTPSMKYLEQELHARFADKRINGEWFALEPADVEYIKGLAS